MDEFVRCPECDSDIEGEEWPGHLSSHGWTRASKDAAAPKAKPVDPDGHEWNPVEIHPRTPNTAIALLHHRHNSGAACTACEILALRKLLGKQGKLANPVPPPSDAVMIPCKRCGELVYESWREGYCLKCWATPPDAAQPEITDADIGLIWNAQFDVDLGGEQKESIRAAIATVVTRHLAHPKDAPGGPWKIDYRDPELPGVLHGWRVFADHHATIGGLTEVQAIAVRDVLNRLPGDET